MHPLRMRVYTVSQKELYISWTDRELFDGVYSRSVSGIKLKIEDAAYAVVYLSPKPAWPGVNGAADKLIKTPYPYPG